MIIKNPSPDRIHQLRSLWKEAFGDTDAFLDAFFLVGFSPDRCRQITVDNQLAAALYWFDCCWNGKKIAYLYAVATKKEFQGQGLCRALIANTHDYLRQLGYAGAALVPGNEKLFSLYKKCGYQSFCPMTTHTVAPKKPATDLASISWQQYETFRKPLLPENAILQEGKTLEFLSTFAQFYQGKHCLLCGYKDNGIFHICEFFGSKESLPGIADALGASVKVRLPGGENTAMYYSLTNLPELPAYLGITLN